jgi:hypothetical protein
MKLFILLSLFFISSSLYAQNLKLIDRSEDGFAIYRLGAPSEDEVRELCDLGVEQIAVLSGNADSYEFKFVDQCPGLKVVYNTKQKAKFPLEKSFLKWFDSWVEESKRLGRKIAFRCNCGCHRTGRLAAYYQMKYQGLTATDAKIIMKKHGKYMVLFPFLNGQVDALENFIAGVDCNKGPRYCVQ